MRFMTMVKSVEKTSPPPPALTEAIAKLGAEASQTGTLIETGGLLPSAAGARVRLSRGKIRVIDGPFAESKEVIGGYAVYKVASKQEAIDRTVEFMELHRKYWPGWDGETEIRQVCEERE
jgi:hypothetical protein